MSKREPKTSDRALATRAHIINSFLKIMCIKQWNKISVKELCEKAAVTRGTFYQYFDSIDDLMENLENETLAEIQSVFTDAAKEFAPKRLLYSQNFNDDYSPLNHIFSLRWLEYGRANKEKLLPMFNWAVGDARFIRRARQVISNHLEYSMNYENLPNDDIRYQYLSLYTDIHIQALYNWLGDERAGEDKIPAEDMAVVIDSFRTGGLYIANRNRVGQYATGDLK